MNFTNGTRKKQAFLKPVLLLIASGFALANAAFAHGDLHEQIGNVTLQILKGPETGELYLKRAELFRFHEDWPAAAADYDRAGELAPALGGLQLGRGQMLLASGRLNEAKLAMDQFLAANPKHAEGFLIRGRIEMKQTKPLIAASDFTRALEYAIRPEPEVYIECARAFAAAGLSEHGAEAVNVLEDGMKTLGCLPALGLYAIELEAAQSRFDSALALLDKLSASANRKEHWLERRGDLLAQSNRHEAARESYQAALQAMAKLPEHIRRTRAMLELQARLDTKTAAGL